MEGGDVRAVVVNSGNANAATGGRGLEDARKMQSLAAEVLGIDSGDVAVASTGVIGEHLPMDRISSGIRTAAAGLGRDGSGFAEAIMTTDTRVKEAAVTVEVGGRNVTVGGTAKGSGMIHPNMGTMLAFLTTDAAVEKECLQETLRATTDRTFNRVTVDGDTSPSDMALLFANGAAGNEPIGFGSPDLPGLGGGRGGGRAAAGKGDRARRRGGDAARRGRRSRALRDEASAAVLVKSVVGSSLVKAAVFGEDANWGRVLTAMGYSGATFDPEGMELYFGPVKVFAGGSPPRTRSRRPTPRSPRVRLGSGSCSETATLRRPPGAAT